MEQQFITVYAEATPNPESIKFVLNKELVRVGTYDYPNPETAQASPLASQLFQFSFVRGVYISQNFVTVTKAPDAMWAELIPLIRTFLKEYVQAGSPIVTEEISTEEEVFSEDDTETVKKIKHVLAQSVKPVVEMDGGNIEFVSYDEGIVTVALRGSCSGCPSSTITLKSGIENLLKRMVPDVKEVVAEAM